MNDVVLVALISASPAIIASIISVITLIDNKRKEKKKEVETKMEEMEKKLSQKIDKIETRFNEHLIQSSEQVGNIQEGMKAILRYNIDQMYDKFTKQGYITFEDQEEIEETYQKYASLKGNHIGEKKYKIMMELPIKNNN